MTPIKIEDLTPEQRYQVEQVIATLRIENMEPSEEDVQQFMQIAVNNKGN